MTQGSTQRNKWKLQHNETKLCDCYFYILSDPKQ